MGTSATFLVKISYSYKVLIRDEPLIAKLASHYQLPVAMAFAWVALID